MNERSNKLLIDAIDAVHSFVGDSDFGAYSANHLLRSAVERQLEILGEVCSQLAVTSLDCAVTLLNTCQWIDLPQHPLRQHIIQTPRMPQRAFALKARRAV